MGCGLEIGGAGESLFSIGKFFFPEKMSSISSFGKSNAGKSNDYSTSPATMDTRYPIENSRCRCRQGHWLAQQVGSRGKDAFHARGGKSSFPDGPSMKGQQNERYQLTKRRERINTEFRIFIRFSRGNGGPLALASRSAPCTTSESGHRMIRSQAPRAPPVPGAGYPRCAREMITPSRDRKGGGHG